MKDVKEKNGQQKQFYFDKDKIGQIMPVGEVDLVYAFVRDQSPFTILKPFGRKYILIIPVILGKDGKYHLTFREEYKVPCDMGVRLVGEVSIF